MLLWTVFSQLYASGCASDSFLARRSLAVTSLSAWFVFARLLFTTPRKSDEKPVSSDMSSLRLPSAADTPPATSPAEKSGPALPSVYSTAIAATGLSALLSMLTEALQ